jgi:hypothetical protein
MAANNVKIINNENNTTVTVSQPTTGVIKVATAGPQGPPGISVNTGSFTNTGSFNAFTSSYNTGSFTGSFTGDGSGLYDIPASGIIGLNLSQISSGSASASISPGNGLQSNVGITAPSFTGSLFGTASFVNVSALLGFTPENVANKVDNLTNPPGGSYPTSNVVKSELGLKEDIANKATSLASPNNTTYPTTQAVVNAIPATITNINQIANRSYNDLQNLPLFIPDRVLAQTNITGSYALDWSLYEVWDLVLTGNSTLTNSNLVNGKTIKILISGNFTLNLTAFNSVKGTYNGAIKNLIVASNINNYLSLTINPAD